MLFSSQWLYFLLYHTRKRRSGQAQSPCARGEKRKAARSGLPAVLRSLFDDDGFDPVAEDQVDELVPGVVRHGGDAVDLRQRVLPDPDGDDLVAVLAPPLDAQRFALEITHDITLLSFFTLILP